MNKLYICAPDANDYIKLAKASDLPDLTLTQSISDAEIVLANPNTLAPLLSQASKLQWVQSTFAGCDALSKKSERHYLLTNVRGVFGPLMSEYVFGFLIPYIRSFSRYEVQQQQMLWQSQPHQRLGGKTMLVLGTGSIGEHIATAAGLFGMKTIGVNRSGASNIHFDTVYSVRELTVALAKADVIVSTLPDTEETRMLLDEQTLRYCRNAIFFNVGRGGVVCERALLKALNKGYICHAYLDVFDTEPLPQHHVFWHHSKVTVTPHISAFSFPEQVFSIFSENYERWRTGEPLKYRFDFERGY
ncbi:D-2-hydroxyacid dehydrogenase [Pseudomaricurvus alkylphenolicus]|uniref:D-2-hydroxyacid dehydrogenase n=1 Tax=Pseudomaricurvus alkylphenolicus TaxID=1306991 RepID=UPI00141E364E|nr:D-2-hydroxyacid dehydrogenase [Pseudomaricurvus alkylphenolicus]NIB42488.1 D-2-hydroxyacid dehydrogenase [Pseudomaricurvus alkylphenolicus]